MLLHCMYDDLEKYENKLKLKLKIDFDKICLLLLFFQ